METFGLLLLAVLSGFALTALFLLLDVFFPKRIELAKQSVTTIPRRSFLIGLVNFLFLAALVITLISLGDSAITRGAVYQEVFNLPALVIMIVLAIGIILGLCTMTQFVGESLFPDLIPLKQKTWGAGLLILACLTPFVGWFGFLPFAGILGLGALIGSWFPPRVKAQPEASQ